MGTHKKCLAKNNTFSGDMYFTNTGKHVHGELPQPLSCWAQIYPSFANSVDPDQLASEKANWLGSTLFVIKHINLYQQSGSSSLTEN